jgi:hypothetical protein
MKRSTIRDASYGLFATGDFAGDYPVGIYLGQFPKHPKN